MRPVETARIVLEMRKNQWLGRDEIEEIQLRKLNRLLSHASATVPHYRSIRGKRLRDLSGLQDLPLLSRTDVRDSPLSFISSVFRPESLIKSFTSGSSGVQMPIFSAAGEEACGMAFECHHLFENGIGLFDRQARITHFRSSPNLLQRLGILRCSYISVQKSDDAIMEELRGLRPDVLCAYPSLLRPLSLRNTDLRFRKVFTGGELLNPKVRALAEKSFGCQVRDRYGSMESSWVAWECEKGSYHVHSDQAILEVVDERGIPVKKGRSGRIVATPLWRMAMPLIRYDLGDQGALGGNCPCGRGLHVFGSIEGRDDDFVVLPSGAVRSARTINLMDDIQDVLSYQIVQEREDLFVFRHVPASGDLPKLARDEIARRIRSGCLGEDVRVEFEQVDETVKGRTGKRRAVISKVIPRA